MAVCQKESCIINFISSRNKYLPSHMFGQYLLACFLVPFLIALFAAGKRWI